MGKRDRQEAGGGESRRGRGLLTMVYNSFNQGPRPVKGGGRDSAPLDSVVHSDNRGQMHFLLAVGSLPNGACLTVGTTASETTGFDEYLSLLI